jgi:hypothetical protein
MRTAAVLALSMVLAGGLGACGDDDDDAGGVELEDVDPGEGDGDDTTTTTGDDGPLLGEDDIPEGALGGCTELIEFFGSFAGAFSGQGEGELDFGTFADGFAAAGEEFGGDIADDFDTMARGFAAVDEALGGEPVDFSDPSVFTSPEFQAASEELSAAEFTEASNNVNAFMSAGCEQ